MLDISNGITLEPDSRAISISQTVNGRVSTIMLSPKFCSRKFLLILYANTVQGAYIGSGKELCLILQQSHEAEEPDTKSRLFIMSHNVINLFFGVVRHVVYSHQIR